jgi:hypothetical protein
MYIYDICNNYIYIYIGQQEMCLSELRVCKQNHEKMLIKVYI